MDKLNTLQIGRIRRGQAIIKTITSPKRRGSTLLNRYLTRVNHFNIVLPSTMIIK